MRAVDKLNFDNGDTIDFVNSLSISYDSASYQQSLADIKDYFDKTDVFDNKGERINVLLTLKPEILVKLKCKPEFNPSITIKNYKRACAQMASWGIHGTIEIIKELTGTDNAQVYAALSGV